jgi:hypothetical protein
LFFILGVVNPLANAAYGDTTKAGEYAIKAAFVFKFGKFVKWPNELLENSNEFILCIVGETTQYKSTFMKLNGKKIQGKTVIVKLVESTEDIDYCHIAFFTNYKKKKISKILSTLMSRGTLTVGEIEGFAAKGGMINFVRKERRIGFEINVEAAESAGLTISSKLVRVATNLVGNSR